MAGYSWRGAVAASSHKQGLIETSDIARGPGIVLLPGNRKGAQTSAVGGFG